MESVAWKAGGDESVNHSRDDFVRRERQERERGRGEWRRRETDDQTGQQLCCLREEICVFDEEQEEREREK